MPGYLSISMMPPGLKDAMLCTLYRHMLKKNHSIDWKNALFVFKNKIFLQMVESGLMSNLPNFNLSSLKLGSFEMRVLYIRGCVFKY